ncbi:hypothetical protein [Paraburkholderia sp. BL10I2N1]|uniref:hypothetical protein n=1 Tax=Paraburkholderia sp. BL10I2N1 TaxID=1938796 RepID=UPI00105D6B20|nr:hypothetical protein [Paraburkholderia sp. BL10I2N1]TDN58892.1 hypothetical protein B0G77_8065 [Paraburkholderia sp. BL10I2N1]
MCALSIKRRAIPYFSICRFGLVLALILSFWAVGGHAQEARYRYVSLDQIELPTGFTSFYPSAIQDSGRVYGTLCDAVCGVTRLAYFKDGKLTLLPPVPPGSGGGPVNARGTIGGSIFPDPSMFAGRAALFRKGRVELVPPQPGEVAAFVFALNDNDTALVESYDASFNLTYVLYHEGTATPINFGQSITNPFFSFFGICRCINNNGIIEGTEGPGLFNGARGFRLDPRNGNATILDPFPGDPTETLAWGQAINQAGDVLGYSFTLAAPYHERIGVWGRNGVFYTYLVENVSSNRLLFNDNNLIVITEIFSTHISYIVPKPGVRLNLADLVVNLPAGQDLYFIRDLNNHGDMIGSSSTGAYFLLQRLEEEDRQAYATPVVNNARRAIPPAVIMHKRLLPQLRQLK